MRTPTRPSPVEQTTPGCLIFSLFTIVAIFCKDNTLIHKQPINRRIFSVFLVRNKKNIYLCVKFKEEAQAIPPQKTEEMETKEQTIQQIERFLKKVAQKFPASENEASVLTDIHVRVSQDSGELLAFDDDDQEITRCVVEQWIDNKDEDFYDEVARTLREVLRTNAKTADNLGILKPYSFVLEDDDKENLGELYLADDDTVIVGGDLMESLDSDLDAFLKDLLK